VDLVAEVGGEIIPFEIKYRSEHTNARDLRGLADFCAGKKIARAYVVTKALNDFGEMEKLPGADTRIMKVPAPLLCYWIGQAESMQTTRVSKVEQDSVQYD
jgi:Holliday junction resolvase